MPGFHYKYLKLSDNKESSSGKKTDIIIII